MSYTNYSTTPGLYTSLLCGILVWHWISPRFRQRQTNAIIQIITELIYGTHVTILTFPDAVPPATPMRNGVVDNPLDVILLLFICTARTSRITFMGAYTAKR